MISIAKLTTALALLVGFSPTALAQTGWNRRVSEVHIVHPPGTPPGMYRVLFTLSITDDSAPVPSDLSFDVALSLNGTAIDFFHGGLNPLNYPVTCVGCSPALCETYSNSWGANLDVYCGFNGSGCDCSSFWIFDPNSWSAHSYLPSDVLGITISASPGSLPEIDTSDDAMTITVGDHNPGLAYCFGDGTLATACPCSNMGAVGHGCANSVNASGALLAATGFTEIDPLTGTDAVVLHGSGMPSTATAIYLKSNNNNPSGVVFADGVRCVSGALIRMGVKPSVGGASSYPGPGDQSISVRGGTPSGSGLIGYYQTYYRDPANFCTALTYNISNGVQITW
jgi:hypothetical protein